MKEIFWKKWFWIILAIIIFLMLQQYSRETECNFIIEETLTNPSTTSVMLTMLPTSDVKAYVEYGNQPGHYTQKTKIHLAHADNPFVFTLENLTSGEQHYYKVGCKRQRNFFFKKRQEHSFRTLRTKKDPTLSFALAADSHIYAGWINYVCKQDRKSNYSIFTFNKTMRNILHNDVDFLIMAGDNVNTHVNINIPACEKYAQYGSGTVRTQQEADLRYQKILSPELFGIITREVPLLYVLGNHDGETRFVGPNQSSKCGYYNDTLLFSRTARLKHLPDPTQLYSGSQQSDAYYTFRSGNTRFIILDIMIGPEDVPTKPEDWVLGNEQLAWFEDVLKSSNETWKFIFMEHLAGGTDKSISKCKVEVPGGSENYNYGRGGLKATNNGETNGTFNGQQAYLNRLMVEHGVTALFHNHDHVAVAGEKKIGNGQGQGIYYIAGGKVSRSGNGPFWATESWFKKLYDYDNDGQADYFSNVTGTLLPGFYKVTVHAQSHVDIEFIESNYYDSRRNNVAVFNFTIYADGTSSLPSKKNKS